jgi:serine/threonine-protein kinase
VSTATDVYSLGVILFELLVGARPYRVKRDTRGAMEEAVLRADIPLPSGVEAGGAAAAARSTTLPRLRRDLRGDLDAILLKMLDRNPGQRYATAAAVADDLARHLGGNIVQAHRPSSSYRLRKFVGRNRLAVASGALVASALLLGAGVALWQAQEAQRQARFADTQRDRALAAATHREAVDEFMADLLLDAGRTGRPVSIAELIGRADKLSAQEFAGDPEARAAVLATVGRFAAEFDGNEKALAILGQSQRLLLNSRDLDLRAHVVCDHAMVLGLSGQGAQAQREFTRIIDDPATPSAARSACLGERAKLAIEDYDGKAAARDAQRALAEWRSAPRRSPSKRLELLAFSAEAEALNGGSGDADRHFAYVVDELKRLGREHSDLADMVNMDRYNTAVQSGDLNAALALTDAVLKDYVAEVPGRPLPATWLYCHSLALMYLQRYEEALNGFEQAARLAATEDSLIQQRAGMDAAAALSILGRPEEAERRYRNAIAVAKDGAPRQDVDTDITRLLTRATLDLDAGRFRAARETLTRVMASPAIAVPTLALAYHYRARAALGEQRIAEALQDAQTAVQLSERLRGGNAYSAWVGKAQVTLGRILQAGGDVVGARASYAAAVLQLTHSVGVNHPAAAEARGLLDGLAQPGPAPNRLARVAPLAAAAIDR